MGLHFLLAIGLVIFAERGYSGLLATVENFCGTGLSFSNVCHESDIENSVAMLQTACEREFQNSCGDFFERADSSEKFLNCRPSKEHCESLHISTGDCLADSGSTLSDMALDTILTPQWLASTVAKALEADQKCYEGADEKVENYVHAWNARIDLMLSEKEIPENIREIIESKRLALEAFKGKSCSEVFGSEALRRERDLQKTTLNAYEQEIRDLNKQRRKVGQATYLRRQQHLQRQHRKIINWLNHRSGSSEGLVPNLAAAIEDGALSSFKAQVESVWDCLRPSARSELVCAGAPLIFAAASPKSGLKSAGKFQNFLKTKFGIRISWRRKLPVGRCVAINNKAQPCGLRSIVVDDGLLDHAQDHVLRGSLNDFEAKVNQKIQAWYASKQDYLIEKYGTSTPGFDKLSRKDKENLAFDLKPIRFKTQTTFFPPGVEPDDVLASISQVKMVRLRRKKSGNTVYNFKHDDVVYEIVICRRGECLKNGDANRATSLYPVCGKGVRVIDYGRNVLGNLGREGKSEFSASKNLLERPCSKNLIRQHWSNP